MTSLLPGGSYTLVQNQVYALPAKAVMVASNAAIEHSMDGTNFSAVTLTNGGAALGSMFIRSAGVGTKVSLKEYSVIIQSSSGTEGGGGATLPTAPLGQVLISQGAGVPPIFSNAPLAGQWKTASATYGAYGADIPEGAMRAHTVHPLEKTFAQIGAGEFIGVLANFSDSTVNTYGATIAGGGTNHILGRWNGTNWIVVGGAAGALPTAAAGQVLISQGVGVPPVFSAAVVVNSLDAKYASSTSEGKFRGAQLILSLSYFANLGPETIGELSTIRDSTVNTPGAIIAGGGAFNVLGRWDGTNWKVVA